LLAVAEPHSFGVADWQHGRWLGCMHGSRVIGGKFVISLTWYGCLLPLINLGDCHCLLAAVDVVHHTAIMDDLCADMLQV
jgi:hypothetical protein